MAKTKKEELVTEEITMEELETMEEATEEVEVTVEESKLNKVLGACKKHGKKVLVGVGLLATGFLIGKAASNSDEYDEDYDVDGSYEEVEAVEEKTE